MTMEPRPISNGVRKTEEEWRKELTPEEYEVLREQGTEAPFSGAFVTNHEKGSYTCKACGTMLFSSDAKFDSGTGWPSFTDLRLQKMWARVQMTHMACDARKYFVKSVAGIWAMSLTMGPQKQAVSGIALTLSALRLRRTAKKK
jgi:hypothetical protein